MTGTEILVTAGGIALIAALAYFFFGPKEARRAEESGVGHPLVTAAT